MKLTGGPETEETVKFILMFDKFFDVLNVTNFTNWARARKPDKKIDDKRLEVSINYVLNVSLFYLQWLEKTFIAYLDDWEESVASRPDSFTPAEKRGCY